MKKAIFSLLVSVFSLSSYAALAPKPINFLKIVNNTGHTLILQTHGNELPHRIVMHKGSPPQVIPSAWLSKKNPATGRLKITRDDTNTHYTLLFSRRDENISCMEVEGTLVPSKSTIHQFDHTDYFFLTLEFSTKHPPSSKVCPQ